ncbi:MAG: hypothetical protein ACI8S6_002226 [Myxococcota bacterium]|jgi:hypothetical protein
MPYLFLGPASSVERPIQIVWELERELPVTWFSAVKIAGG